MRKLVILVLLGLIISACGRMSRPVAPEGSTYPQTYIIKE